MEGGYEVKSNFETTSQNVNLDFFGIKMGFYPSSVAQIDVDLGRIFISDSYGLIFNNSVDGGKLKISLPVANLSMFAGYTGLLNGKNFQIVNSTIEVDQDAIYSFAPGFMVAGFDITSKNTFENHSLGLNVSSFVPVFIIIANNSASVNDFSPYCSSFSYGLSVSGNSFIFIGIFSPSFFDFSSKRRPPLYHGIIIY